MNLAAQRAGESRRRVEQVVIERGGLVVAVQQVPSPAAAAPGIRGSGASRSP
jgi:hypothetical protein